MKRLIYFISILLIFFPGGNLKAFSQPLPEITSRYYNSIEPVTLQLSKYPHGRIQWQNSRDNGLTWASIEGATGYSCTYSSDTTSLIRALILSGTCDSLFSDYTLLKTLKIHTYRVDSLTDNLAWIHCRFQEGDSDLKEYGLLWGDKPSPDLSAEKISFPPPLPDSLSIKLDQLQAGKTYYARAFGISSDDYPIYGNVLEFTPVKISFTNKLNISTDTVQLFYTITGLAAEQINQHGIIIDTVPDLMPSSLKITGTSENGLFKATAESLSAGKSYYVHAYVQKNNEIYYSSVKKITTWSVYDDPPEESPFTISHKIVWNEPSSARKISQDGTFGEYGRVERIGNTDTLLLVYHGGPSNGDWINIYLRKSYDNGNTWEPQQTLMNLADYPGEYWRFCTPEIIYLQNGWILMAFEANARPDENQSSVQILISRDSAQSWDNPIIYKTGRTWEPSMVQLPHGEIELFYSSEARWWPNSPIYQDIQVIRSTDNGLSWSDPEIIAYYPAKRDGMPVPIVLQENRGVIFAIETVNAGQSPYIIHREMNEPWTLTTINFENSLHRWLVTGFSGHGGAPYLLQLPSGETILSAHIYRGGDWHQNNYQQVMIGDNKAKNFGDLTTPWGVLPINESAVNNSLFLKDNETIVSISSRMFTNGSGGVYWLEGKIVPK